jgi:hypothetical protein
MEGVKSLMCSPEEPLGAEARNVQKVAAGTGETSARRLRKRPERRDL